MSLVAQLQQAIIMSNQRPYALSTIMDLVCREEERRKVSEHLLHDPIYDTYHWTLFRSMSPECQFQLVSEAEKSGKRLETLLL